MVSRPQPMDVSDSPELLRLAEEVDATHEPRLLRRGDHALALIVPLTQGGRPDLSPRGDHGARQPSAGNWVEDELDDTTPVTRRTAGMLRRDYNEYSIEEETQAFEQGVALENALPER
jgi:hypothetical protein